MILGRSHPENTDSEVTIEVAPGGGYLVMPPQEYERFLAGETITRISGDCKGRFKVTARMERLKGSPDGG